MAEQSPTEQGQEHAIYSVILGFIVLAVIFGGIIFIFVRNKNNNSDTSPTPTPTLVPTKIVTPTPTLTDTPSAQETPEVTPTQAATSEVTIELSGHNYAFSQNEIRVAKDTMVTVEFTSTDGFHDFTLDGYNVSTDRINTGNTTSVTFLADKVGTFDFYCSVGNHRALGMEGTFIVE